MPTEIHHGDNEQFIVANLIDDAMRKAVRAATACIWRHEHPSLGVKLDAHDRRLDLMEKIRTEAGLLRLVVFGGFSEFT